MVWNMGRQEDAIPPVDAVKKLMTHRLPRRITWPPRAVGKGVKPVRHRPELLDIWPGGGQQPLLVSTAKPVRHKVARQNLAKRWEVGQRSLFELPCAGIPVSRRFSCRFRGRLHPFDVLDETPDQQQMGFETMSDHGVYQILA